MRTARVALAAMGLLALGGASMADVADCTVTADNDDRLACYDAIFRARGIGEDMHGPGRPLDAEERGAVVAYFRDIVREPDSTTIRFLPVPNPRPLPGPDVRRLACMVVNTKNGFGGYTGPTLMHGALIYSDRGVSFEVRGSQDDNAESTTSACKTLATGDDRDTLDAIEEMTTTGGKGDLH